MKTDYVLTRRALLGISALFCTTLLLFGCQDTEIPVGPELDTSAVSETVGDTFAGAKPDPSSCDGPNPDHHCPDSGGNGDTPTLSLAGGMQATAFDVGVKDKKNTLEVNNYKVDFEKPTI